VHYFIAVRSVCQFIKFIIVNYRFCYRDMPGYGLTVMTTKIGWLNITSGSKFSNFGCKL